jgi:calcium-translocating P-type ATPase
MTTHWYRLDTDQCLAALESSHDGLSSAKADDRLAEYGANELALRKTPRWKLFARQFNDPMIWILLATGITTGVLTAIGEDMLPDTIVILGVVLLNALLGFVQEGKAEGALDALRSMMVPTCRVVRDADSMQIAARQLVPGDIVLLESGDKIPADIRFVTAHNLHVDESSLTGESVPVQKSTDALSGCDLVPGDQRNMGFSGTYVTQGSARALVVATGSHTLFGRIAEMVKSAGDVLSPLQRKMREFVRSLILAILVIGAFNFALGVYLGYAASYSFLGAVSLVVAAIPEMLPALVTSILALSGTVMAARKALVRHLPAAETLGATTVICSDKTGTLTENHMTVTRVYSGGDQFSVSGSGTLTEGDFQQLGEHHNYIDPTQHRGLMALLHCGYHCNDAHLSAGDGTGDPTEIALKVSGAKAGVESEGIDRLVEIPFDSTEKFMAVLVRHRDQHFILIKGAPEVIVGMCDAEIGPDGLRTGFDPKDILGVASLFAADSLRTLGFAMKPVSLEHRGLSRDDLTGLTFLGLQGMIDPPKPEAIRAVASCQSAGIRTIMITGDHPDTALAVSRELGIPADEVMTGSQLSRLGDASLRNIVEKVSVYARVAPEHKRAIAMALQENGHIVAMTGDGVNDAPALKQADIGVAMGVTGTEVAKEAADMVLADDNFATIVAAVEEGRHAWNNLRKAILYTLPTNAAQAILIMGAILMAAFIPLFGERFVLEPVQILWINLLDSVLLTLPLMMERKERGLLDVPPRDPKVRIITPLFLQRVVLIGLAIAIPGFVVYHHFGAAAMSGGELIDPQLLTQAQTAAFWAILFGHIGYVVSARSIHRSAFTFNPLGNYWLLAGIGLSIAIRFVPTLIPEAAALFKTADFPSTWWPIILLCFLPSFVMIESDKLVRRLHNRSWSQRHGR